MKESSGGDTLMAVGRPTRFQISGAAEHHKSSQIYNVQRLQKNRLLCKICSTDDCMHDTFDVKLTSWCVQNSINSGERRIKPIRTSSLLRLPGDAPAEG